VVITLLTTIELPSLRHPPSKRYFKRKNLLKKWNSYSHELIRILPFTKYQKVPKRIGGNVEATTEGDTSLDYLLGERVGAFKPNKLSRHMQAQSQITPVNLKRLNNNIEKRVFLTWCNNCSVMFLFIRKRRWSRRLTSDLHRSQAKLFCWY